MYRTPKETFEEVKFAAIAFEDTNKFIKNYDNKNFNSKKINYNQFNNYDNNKMEIDKIKVDVFKKQNIPYFREKGLCYKCGNKGHLLRDCPMKHIPSQHAAINNLKINNKNKEEYETYFKNDELTDQDFQDSQ